MAAATIADGTHKTVFGNKRVRFATLTAPADDTTWDTGLLVVQNVQIAQIGDVAAGTDVATVKSVSGSTVTFSVDGTAADLYVLAIGY